MKIVHKSKQPLIKKELDNEEFWYLDYRIRFEKAQINRHTFLSYLIEKTKRAEKDAERERTTCKHLLDIIEDKEKEIEAFKLSAKRLHVKS